LLFGREFLIKASCGVPTEGHSSKQQRSGAQQTTQAFHTETSLFPFLYHKWKPQIAPMTRTGGGGAASSRNPRLKTLGKTLKTTR
jgi:hypothetical protein